MLSAITFNPSNTKAENIEYQTISEKTINSTQKLSILGLKGRIRIEISGTNSFQYKIANINGLIIAAGICDYDTLEITVTPGVYIVSVTHDSGIYTQKVIVG